MTISEILDIIKERTPYSYAYWRMHCDMKNPIVHVFNSGTGDHTQKKVSYEEYLQTNFGKPGDSIEVCKNRCVVSYLEDYAYLINLYTGWVNNGKLFVLNTQEKYISFLFEKAKIAESPSIIKLHTNYNPLGVDCIEQSMPVFQYQKLIDSQHLVQDTDENKLIQLCDELIKKS